MFFVVLPLYIEQATSILFVSFCPYHNYYIYMVYVCLYIVHIQMYHTIFSS